MNDGRRICVFRAPGLPALPMPAGFYPDWQCDNLALEPGFVDKAVAADPALVVLDARAHPADAPALVSALRARLPRLHVLVIGPPDLPALAAATMQHGAAGYLSRDLDATRIAEAIQSLLCGRIFMSRTGREGMRRALAAKTGRDGCEP